MNQSNKKNSLEELLRDTKHNKKANEVFLKLMAKNKCKANPWNVVRSSTYIPSDKSDLRN
jgi:hypothetical protein